MKLVFRRFAFFAIFLGSGVVACPGVGDVQTKDGKQLVKASLVTDVCAIQSGQKFRIGVLYQIEPGWHIYWKDSGDSGIPTKIDWKLPVGFKVGELQWPLPIRDKEPGDLEVFTRKKFPTSYHRDTRRYSVAAWITFLVFLFIGLGMALPYLFLAVNPAWIRYLPKPGNWMIRLKQLMGFLLLATLLWLAWIVGQRKGVDAIVLLGALLLVIAILSWIKGAFLTPVASPTARAYALGAMLLVVLGALGCYPFITKPTKLSWQSFSPNIA